MSLLQRKFGERFSGSPAAATSVDVPVAQRVRVGLTGLAAIFLVILIATVGLRPTVSMATPQAVDEPLVVLGVAPGAGMGGIAASAASPTETAAAPRSPSRPKRG